MGENRKLQSFYEALKNRDYGTAISAISRTEMLGKYTELTIEILKLIQQKKYGDARKLAERTTKKADEEVTTILKEYASVVLYGGTVKPS